MSVGPTLAYFLSAYHMLTDHSRFFILPARGREAASRLAHNQEIAGATPAPATKRHARTPWVFFDEKKAPITKQGVVTRQFEDA